MAATGGCPGSAEEVALLAGVSIDYYTRLERGKLNGVSEGVLEALADALQLDEAERAHLFDLARAGNTLRTRRRTAQPRIRPSVQRILDAITDAPAYVRNARRDILAANRLGFALYSEMYRDPARPVNVARFVFLNPQARMFFLDWHGAANDTVAILRIEAGRNPHDLALTDLVEGALDAERGVPDSLGRAQRTPPPHRAQRHPSPGRRDLHLMFEALDLPADPGLSLVVYTADLASPSRCAQSPRQLGRNPRPGRQDRDRRSGPRDGPVASWCGCQAGALTAEGLAHLKKGTCMGTDVSATRAFGSAGLRSVA